MAFSLLFSFLLFFPTLLFLIIASLTDLKERVVSNRLNYSMLALGIGLHALWAFLESDWTILAWVLACVVATFIASFAFWKLGVWAGGDVKLFTALAALVPLNPAFLPQILGYASGIFAPLQIPVFPLELFIFSIFSMFPIGVLVSIRGILKRKALKERVLKDLKGILLSALLFAFAIAGLEALLSFYSINLWLAIIPLAILGFLPSKARAVASVLLFIAGFFVSDSFSLLSNFALSLISLFAVSAFLKLFFVSRNEVLVVSKKISRMEEGEIVAESFLEAGKGKILRSKGLSLSETFKYLKTSNLAGLLKALRPEGRVIADRHSAAGVSLEELKELKMLVKKKRLEDKVLVKLSTPFVPGVLCAFLLLAFLSDAFWRLLFP